MYSEFLETSIGVPQGSNLGPLFFIIFFNDLPTYIESDIDCYADDSTLGATAGDVAEIGRKLTSDCSSLSQWMSENKFKLNASKTHLMIMGTSARLRNVGELHVVMDGEALEKSEDHKELLLGVVVQSDLKWSLQVKKLADKLKMRLTGLEKLKQFMNRSKKNDIVKGIFNSVLCYCLPLFGGCSTSEKNDLQTLQNRAARLVLNYPPRSNRDMMFNKLNWLSVRQLIVYHQCIRLGFIRFQKTWQKPSAETITMVSSWSRIQDYSSTEILLSLEALFCGISCLGMSEMNKNYPSSKLMQKSGCCKRYPDLMTSFPQLLPHIIS